MRRPLIAVLRGVTPLEAKDIGSVLIDAGLTRIEIPMSAPSALKSIETLAKAYGDAAHIGAGAVLTPQTVIDVAKAGARVVYSPNTDTQVISTAKLAGLQCYPGVMTPTECFAALGAGADGLTLFPASLIGPSGLTSLRSVLPVGTQIFAANGPDNSGNSDFAAWIAAGADGFNIGSALYQPGVPAAEVSQRARALITAFDRATPPFLSR